LRFVPSEPVNVHEAKTHLSRLLQRVADGEEITIAKAGTPVAKLVPIREVPVKRRPGSLKDRIRIAPDFDDPLPPDLQQYFE
jgi:prevent-host-death family protein